MRVNEFVVQIGQDPIYVIRKKAVACFLPDLLGRDDPAPGDNKVC